MRLVRTMLSYAFVAVLGSSSFIAPVSHVAAASLANCTVLPQECAQQALTAALAAQAVAEKTKETTDALRRDLDELRKAHDRLNSALGKGRILALAKVIDGKPVFRSDGVEFIVTSGNTITITFPNPRHILFVPIVTTSNDTPYITYTAYVKSQGTGTDSAADHIVVVGNAMDTSGRPGPLNFTIAVIGFESSASGPR